MKKYNLNDSIVIYPNEKGWLKIEELFRKKYKFGSQKELTDFINLKTTLNSGYKDQLCSIMCDLNEIFYNGSYYLETTSIDLCNYI